MLSELKKFKVQSILILEYEKRDDHKSMHKIFHLNPKLNASDSDIDRAFKSIHQSIMMKLKNSAKGDWVVETIGKHSIKIFEC